MILWCDFETKSTCNLKVSGAYNYARDPSTEILCLSYAFGDEPVQTCTADTIPERVRRHKGQIRAHNAGFDRLIFWYIAQIDFDLEQFYCTATQARANCAPGSLEDVGRFFGARMRKDHRGAALLRKFCMPPFSTDDPAELIEYCERDVEAMREISTGLRELSDDELADYHQNERINDRGVLVDVVLARAATRYSKAEAVQIERRVREVTGGAVTSVRSPKMREWVLERVDEDARALMWTGEKYSIDKTVRANLLQTDSLPADVREVVESADEIWSSSVAKFGRMATLADIDDHRVRGAFVFNGGAATGRASSYGLQVHNFPRKSAKDPVASRAAMMRGEPVDLKSMLRPALIPAPGKHFIVADWSSIEARVTPWASGHGEAKLDIFRSGRDPYKVNAATTFGVTYEGVDTDQRQIGKVQELACGFAGGEGAFAAMGRAYGVVLDNPQAAVDGWRRANPWAPRYWSALESSYLMAMRRPGELVKVGRVAYLYDRTHLWYELPSGRVLCYPFAAFNEAGEVTYAKAAWRPKQDAKEWPRARLWKGLACENITQAIANDILRHALRHLDDVVLHVHDEIVIEIETDREVDLSVMTTPPEWATGLPLAIEVKKMTRYGK